MRILVTGGAGFIGSHLVHKLAQDKHDVTVVDDLSGGFPVNLTTGVRFFAVDCRNERDMDKIMFTTRPDMVYHLAANAAENKAQFSPIDVTSRNYDAFIKVLTPFIKYGGRRFIFTSSIAVYGALQTPFRESNTPEPEDLYGISKLAIEQSLKVMSRVHDFEYVIVRPHNVYGPRQNMTDPYRNVVTIWMNQILNKKPCVIYGEGKQVRQFSYIDEVVEPLFSAGFVDKAKNKTFNVGGEMAITLKELYKKICEVTEWKGDPIYLPMRPQEVMSAVADHVESDRVLGFHEVTLKEGLRRTWEWAKQKGPQELRFTPIEIPSEKIPENWRGE